jgi:hypothetical protein
MTALQPLKASGTIHSITQHHSTGLLNLQQHYCEDLKPHKAELAADMPTEASFITLLPLALINSNLFT